MIDDKRLIEDYLPIVAISAEASREKSVRKGHISTLHLWWARRPLVACRAAVYGALVPASRFVPENGPDNKKQSLGRANAAKFVTDLCKYPGDTHTIQEAQRHIFIAHSERLTQELADWKAGSAPKPGWVEEFKFKGDKVAVEDIIAEHAPRPRVLDMFAGGGAIPLEALRLGCEAHALDLNPVAHIIQLCTLVYPQKYGKPDSAARGMTGPKNEKGETTWGGLAEEVRYWGNWVLKNVKTEIGDLYPPIPDPTAKPERLDGKTFLPGMDTGDALTTQPGFLMPVAYLWTRTVKCKNPACGATVPLVKQTWLCKKEGRYVAMKMVAPKGKKEVRFEIVEARTAAGLGFDPEAFSKAGNAACPFCSTVADSDYVKSCGVNPGYAPQPMAVMAVRPGRQGKLYFPATEDIFAVDSATGRIAEIEKTSGISAPTEPLEANPRSFDIQRYGFSNWRMAFSERQIATHLSVAHQVNLALSEMKILCSVRWEALAVCTALAFSRLVTQHNAFAFLHSGRETIEGPWGDGKFPMSYDFLEANPFSGVAASFASALKWVSAAYESISGNGLPAHLARGSATQMPFPDASMDCVVTDPPYYDSVSYSNLSDAFYIWLKRSLGAVMPEHFASELTPKKTEAIMAAYRHHGGKQAASVFYETIMSASLAESNRVLKPGGILAIVYAHKTTLGWSTLVDALRAAAFTIDEAWPLDTEMKGGRKKVGRAMLASSIFLVARKRDPSSKVGNYETDVVQELGSIVRERVETLWQMGISGADLVIACVGAGLRAFTKYARVEYGNGEEVPAERFLAEVETVVLETILGKLSRTVGVKGGETSLAGLDPATRFYVLWRYTYGAAELDAGEAIIFANGTHVELDGQHSLTQGTHALLEKKKNKYCLHDFTERGEYEKLGIREESQTENPLRSAVDALHRLLWLLEHKPPKVPEFLNEAKPNMEQLRLIAQALAGPALKGGELADISPTAEQSALGKLLANWNAIMVGKAVVEDFRAGQPRLFNK
ncbi:MAG: DUF1156 domain-containing protein [Elusimicrobiota bacterium]|nr:DUF1156 domain-containing protein [Elusimicrobiota bacterium]